MKAVVFDFDGVIANSEPLHFRAFRDVLADEGITLSESEYYERYLGYNDERAFHEIVELLVPMRCDVHLRPKGKKLVQGQGPPAICDSQLECRYRPEDSIPCAGRCCEADTNP